MLTSAETMGVRSALGDAGSKIGDGCDSLEYAIVRLKTSREDSFVEELRDILGAIDGIVDRISAVREQLE